MTIFLSTFKAIASLFVIGLVGFFITRKKVLPEKLLDALSTLALDFALPCLVFHKIIVNFNFDSGTWLRLPAYWIIFTLLAVLISFAGSSLVGSKYKGEFRLSATFQNAIFIPIITVNSLWENDGTLLVYIFLFTLFYPAFFFNFYFIFFKKRQAQLNWKKMINPVFVATIVAILIKAIKADGLIPSFVILSLEMIANMAIPLIMMVVGGIIYIDLKASGKLNWVEMARFIFIKNFVFPFIAIIILIHLHLDPKISFLLIMQAAVPPLTANPLFCERAGGNRFIGNQYLVSSFLMALISYPLAIYCYQYFNS